MQITELFGKNVFNYNVMKELLPDKILTSLKNTIENGAMLKPDVADSVANAMKNWALAKGATHYTHWFQPLTGTTAEKHDSFLEPAQDGEVLLQFSGKQLIKGEPDASSFPNGGLRSTFEARGYTAWDTTSPAFLKEDSNKNVTLCIPTAFFSYTGEALDEKIPLLHSMNAVSKHAYRIIKALGNTTSKKVFTTVGPEQEYFLVDKELFDKRMDLLITGRTLFGAAAPKGQEIAAQYFGSIKDRVLAFMSDLNSALWKMGISAKTQHNEVAPGQFEMAPVFSSTNISADHNQLVMETMKKVALRHNLVCLLHEKPFAGVNGSGKHLNWSLATDDGINILDPGKTPHENAQFLIFITAIIKAVDTHQDLLRRAASGAGNDHRLGGQEAPPAIVSMFLGEDLLNIFESDKNSENTGRKAVKIGIDSIPPLPLDNSDRNRTSPFAFTGNRFEFRMVGSSASISRACVSLNAIAAEAFDEIATRLEKTTDISGEVAKIISETYASHKRIICNGNNYSEKWVKEAESRGLLNLRSTVQAMKLMLDEKNYTLFEKYGILTRDELKSRHEIYLEHYISQIEIEAETAIMMTKRQYSPSIIKFMGELSRDISSLEKVSIPTKVQTTLLKRISEGVEHIDVSITNLKQNLAKAKGENEITIKADLYENEVLKEMGILRTHIDALESLIPSTHWPVPTYSDLLFRL